MALSRPYLMHAVQTVTAIQDRHLSDRPGRRSIPEIYHLSHAAAQFRAQLSVPLKDSERDAIWITSIMLGVSAFAYTDADTPAESWPLKPSDPSDLEWIRMTDMKSAIYRLTDPLREGSMFLCMKDDDCPKYAGPPPAAGIEGIPTAFVALLGLTPDSTAETSPYFEPMHYLSRLLKTTYTRSSFTQFLSFIMYTTPAYRRLLGIKDPRALLILAYWYGTVTEAMWWMSRRAVLECQATCLYLEKYHGGDWGIREMLAWPRMRCGLGVAVVELG
jgi:hypothetical protein